MPWAGTTPASSGTADRRTLCGDSHASRSSRIAMHEYGLVQELITLAQAELQHEELASRVDAVTVKVGILSGASPEAMQMAFTVLVAGTPWDGARLEIVTSYPICHCRACGCDTVITDYVFACPECKGLDFVIAGGNELHLMSIDIED